MCVIFYLVSRYLSNGGGLFTYIPLLSQTGVSGPSRAPRSPSPSSRLTKEKWYSGKGKDERKRQRKVHYEGWPGPPFWASLPSPSSGSSSGGSPTVTMQPTLVSHKNPSTASVAFSFHNHLAEGGLECFYPHVFPMSFHNFLAWGAHARHLVKR